MIIADKQHREMELFAQTKFLQEGMLERLVQHLATNGEPLLKDQYVICDILALHVFFSILISIWCEEQDNDNPGSANLCACIYIYICMYICCF